MPDQLKHTPLGFKWGNVEVKCRAEFDGIKIISIDTPWQKEHFQVDPDGDIHKTHVTFKLIKNTQ